MAYISFQPSDFFEATTYTGDASTLAITSLNFQPDFLWIKRRSSASTHALFNSTVGRAKSLGSESSDPEYTSPSDKDLISFDSNGFTVGQPNQRNVNGSGQTFVGWSWLANGGTTSSNTDGTITSTVQANTTSGFSIVTYTGTGANATVGHGLGVAPKMIICKQRNNTSAHDWIVYHESMGNTGVLQLNQNYAKSTYSVVWNSTSPTSSVFSLGTAGSVNESGKSQLAYCFAEIKGYSKFGTYTGNGSSDGTFIYTGFRPAFFLLKRTDTANSWNIFDSARETYNPEDLTLYPNLSDAEYTETDGLDFLSNGVKMREGNPWNNASGGTYIYMAFAEFPLVGSNGIAGTAR